MLKKSKERIIEAVCGNPCFKEIYHIEHLWTKIPRFPGILRQNDNSQRFFLTWNAICQILLDTRTTGNNVMGQDDKKFNFKFENQVVLWMKIITWHTFQNPNMKFPDISLTFAPFQNFPDIFSNSLTIPCPWKNKFFPDFSLTCGNPAWVNQVVELRTNIVYQFW